MEQYTCKSCNNSGEFYIYTIEKDGVVGIWSVCADCGAVAKDYGK